MRSLRSYDYPAIVWFTGVKLYWKLQVPLFRRIAFHALHIPVCACLLMLSGVEMLLHDYLLPHGYKMPDRWGE